MDVNQFEQGQWIPECQLIIQWEREDQRPVQLIHKVKLIGAQLPYDYFHLTLNPAVEGTVDQTTRVQYVGAPYYIYLI